MEVSWLLSLLSATTGWQYSPDESGRVTQPAWENLQKKVISTLQRATEVHQARCHTGNLTLGEIYQEELEKVATTLKLMFLVAPLLASSLVPQLTEEFETLLQRQILVGDLLELLEAEKLEASC